MKNEKAYEWAVIGAGAAGIAAVGKLMDYGIEPSRIAWLDPEFTVGDLGKLWSNVPSNTKVGLFLKFLAGCQAFAYDSKSKNFELNQLDRNNTCDLRYIVEPLQWITTQLADQVATWQTTAENLSLANRCWHIKCQDFNLLANNVILAVGAKPKTLPYTTPVTIPLEVAMDKLQLSANIQANDVVAVFGSSHSAILVLRNLVECGVKQIINFYRMPLRYAISLDEGILFDNTGLKGTTAEWARENIDGQLPKNMIRLFSNHDNIEHHLPQCNKAIYAIGFERRHLPILVGMAHAQYSEETGIIAPGLFGLGIAYPEKRMDRFGVIEHRVGLWKFMEFIDHVMPIWLRYPA